MLSSVELLRNGRFFLVRARTTDGAVGLAEGHGPVLESAWPILVKRIAPYFAEKGVVRVPTGPGLGVEFDPAFLRSARVVEG